MSFPLFPTPQMRYPHCTMRVVVGGEGGTGGEANNEDSTPKCAIWLEGNSNTLVLTHEMYWLII